MSTHCLICYKDDKYHSAYCHYDGYLDGVGSALLEIFNDFPSAKKLVSVGQMEMIHNYFGEYRINGDHSNTFDTLDSLFEEANDTWSDFIYVYDTSSNTWLYTYYGENGWKNLMNLDEELNKNKK